MQRFKFIGIAPYEGFKGYFQNSIKKHSNVDADIYSVSLDSAVDLIKSLDLNKYDAVISRGRTGKMVQSVIDIPFVNVEFSGYDLMRALKQAQFSGKENIAFVSFFDLASNIKILSELLEFKHPVITVNPPANKNEMRQVVKQLYENEGIDIFIGDGACIECVEELGINIESILITSGEESMDKAIDEAMEIVKYKKDAESKNNFYLSLFEQSELPITLFNNEKEIVFSSMFSSSEASELHKTLKKYVSKALNESEINTIEHTSSGIWKIHGKCVTIDDKGPYALFSVKKSFLPTEKKGLTFELADIKQAKDCVSLISSSIALRETWEKIKNWSETKMPILIYGGSGTGKKTFALAAYAISKFSSNPLIIIDCGNLDIKALSALFDDDRSPLYENDYTILFKKVNLLNTDLQNKLSYYISNTMLTSRNKIISTFTGDAKSMISSNTFSKDLYHQLAGIPIAMPYLHERAEDIPAICRSFLMNINQQMPVQIVGFEPEAMELLKNHNWDYGITQLNFLLKQLVTIIKGQFITVEDVNSILSQSDFKPKAHYDTPSIDLSKTLDEISVEVINLVLAEEKNNQSRAAKRLGISRSTLWKKLNS